MNRMNIIFQNQRYGPANLIVGLLTGLGLISVIVKRVLDPVGRR